MTPTTFSPIAARFAWKEYRMLRGMWIGVAAIGVMAQWLSAALAIPRTNLPPVMLGLALGAAVLYAIGAAAVLFAVEHEEETHAFLSGLPMRWLPMFFSKQLVALLSAIALAAVLAFTGWAFTGWPSRTGQRWPDAAEAEQLLAILGVGIFEALAWGTLFSLLVKRPLAAAMLTIFVGVVSVQLIVSGFAVGVLGAADPDAYVNAVPTRLAVLVPLWAICFAIARNWLLVARSYRAPSSVSSASSNSNAPVLRAIAYVSSVFASSRQSASHPQPSRLRVFARLLWQTWRQSWKMLLAPALVALLLTLGAGAATAFTQNQVFPAAATIFFLPALYGAMVFAADQRRRSYRFLAEHAAWPRYVWLVRQLVWGGALAAILLLITATVLTTSGTLYFRQMQQLAYLEPWQFYNSPRYSSRDFAQLLAPPLDLLVQGASLAACGSLLAYSVGQFFSMLLRSEIMAAFASCVASLFVSVWCGLMLNWGLGGAIFVLPIALGLLAATWLRAPNWIVERNSWRSWLWPAAAFLVPALAVAALVPAARMAQIPLDQLTSAEAVNMPVRNEFRAGDTPDARDTAQMYLNIADEFDAWRSDNPLDRWRLDSPLTPPSPEDGGAERFKKSLAERATMPLDGDAMTAGELKDYENAVKGFWKLYNAAAEVAVKEFIVASRRPSCRFDFDLRYAPLDNSFRNVSEMDRERKRLDPQYARIVGLAYQLDHTDAARRLVLDWRWARLRSTAHLRSAQPTLIFTEQLSTEAEALGRIGRWASMRVPQEYKGDQIKEPTDEKIRKAIKTLEDYFASVPDPAEAIWADRELVAEVLDDKTPPLRFSYPPIPFNLHVAYMLHQLPWEQWRARLKLELLTAADIRRVNSLLQCIRTNNFDYSRPTWPRSHEELRATLRGETHASMRDSEIASLTPDGNSLVDVEYHARVHARELEQQLVETEMHRRATLLQLALVLYHRDHGNYPERLSALSPDYLSEVPVDPYSGKQFLYLPRGADLRVDGYAVSGHYVEPGTPFFWSVGPYNLTKLVRYARFEDDYSSIDEDGKVVYPAPVAAYRFATDEVDWNASPAVFPLPK